MKTKVRRSQWRTIAGAAIMLALVAMVGQGVLSSLNATVSNVSAQNANSGTLVLDLANDGDGFSTSINNLAPGDVVNRYVTLTNSGTLDGIGLSVKTAQTGTPNLINDGVSTQALRLTINECSVPWDANTGACTGGALSTEVVSAALGSFTSNTGFSNGLILSLAERYIQLSIELPDQNETTVNGQGPQETIQGGAVNITYTFDIAQRLATTTNS